MRIISFVVTMLLSFGAVAADLTLRDLDGQAHSLSDYRGKWVIVNYWATWCPPCREEIPELVLFHEEHKDHDAVVWGVNLENIDADELRQFVDDAFITYPVLRADVSSVNALGPVNALPTTYIVDPNGKVVSRAVGAVSSDSLENFINNYSH